MSRDNSIAWSTIFLNFSIFVPLFTNLWLRFVGAENHRSPHWSVQSTSISFFQCSQCVILFQGNAGVRDPLMFPQRNIRHSSNTFHHYSWCKIQVQKRFTTALFVRYCFGINSHTRSKFRSNPFSSLHPPTLSIMVNASAACRHLP